MTARLPRKIRRTIFIGLGGTGNEVIRHLKQEMLLHGYDLPLFQYLVMDTVAFDERPGMEELKHLRNGEEYLYIGGYNPNEILKNLANWPVIARWWGNRMRTNLVAVDEGAGQMRSVGRMGFFYHFNKIESQLRRMIYAITDRKNNDDARLNNYDVLNNDPIVYLVFSLCGGTGSSLFFDVAYVIRHMLNGVGLKPTIVGILMLPGPYLQSINSAPQRERIQANGYAALTELERLHNIAMGMEPRPNGKDIWSVQYSTNYEVESADLPFEYTYLIDDVNTRGTTIGRQDIYSALGKAMFWLSAPSTASDFWARAKNLVSKTMASGGTPDPSGRKRLTPYSSLGISTIKLDWSLERMQYALENLFIEHIRAIPPLKPPPLPRFLNNEISLVEEVSGESTNVNPFPPAKALQASPVNDAVAIQEMLERHTEKYQATLNNFARSPLWMRRREDCRKELATAIDQHMHKALQERGPVATTQELEAIQERLRALIVGFDDLSQKEKLLRRELEDEYASIQVPTTSRSVVGQAIDGLLKALKIVYLFKKLRGTSATPRDLTAQAKRGAAQRYRWYTANFNIKIYNDIVETILKPAILHVDECKITCEHTDSELEMLYEENQRTAQLNNLQYVQNYIDRIRPRLTERKHIEEAIKSGRLKIDQKLAEVFKEAFASWPKPGGDAMTDLRPALSRMVSTTLRVVGGEKHLVQLLCETEYNTQSQRLLESADCMWNFATDVSQDILKHIEPIDTIAYGIDRQQGLTIREMEDTLDLLLRNQAAQPQKVSTDISDEVVLFKTAHGLPISAIRPMKELQHAYQVMNTVRAAPYLHIDYADYVRLGYKSLANAARTYQELFKQWDDEANDLDHSDPKLADEIRDALKLYQQTLQKAQTFTHGLVEVKDETGAFFKFVDDLRLAIRPHTQTTAVSQALMKLADLEDIILSQGWIKIDPAYGERFKAENHFAQAQRSEPGMLPERVIELFQPGYRREKVNSTGATILQIRRAQVVKSI